MTDHETVEVTVQTLEELFGRVDVGKCNDEAITEASVVLEAQESNRVTATHE